jgi:hypothetical protein
VLLGQVAQGAHARVRLAGARIEQGVQGTRPAPLQYGLPQ